MNENGKCMMFAFYIKYIVYYCTGQALQTQLFHIPLRRLLRINTPWPVTLTNCTKDKWNSEMKKKNVC